eukprot:TRINITY_DN10679_c0_g2_i1.p1 TRINITY_DN10679_c0_g2~~TRINITY_DN10679_c0_g2_i1.p1  ORF type:complete len:216 (+),score=5.03 TRINITY_DN10679_c0_g2_i1:98-745(+)
MQAAEYLIEHMDVMPDWKLGSRLGCCEGFSNACKDVHPMAPITVRFCFNAHLSLNLISSFNLMPWASKLPEWNPSILIMNTGAHQAPSDMKFKRGRDALYYARAMLPSALILWWTTYAGHLNCTSYAGPISIPQDRALLPYEWGKFRDQNEKMKPEVEHVGAVLMDFEHMIQFRPEGHFGTHSQNPGKVDCLHYCHPGPVDASVKMFYHVLKKLL